MGLGLEDDTLGREDWSSRDNAAEIDKGGGAMLELEGKKKMVKWMCTRTFGAQCAPYRLNNKINHSIIKVTIKLYAWYKMNSIKTTTSGSNHIIKMLTYISIWYLNHKYKSTSEHHAILAIRCLSSIWIMNIEHQAFMSIRCLADISISNITVHPINMVTSKHQLILSSGVCPAFAVSILEHIQAP